jgi:hypothetical protein
MSGRVGNWKVLDPKNNSSFLPLGTALTSIGLAKQTIGDPEMEKRELLNPTFGQQVLVTTFPSSGYNTLYRLVVLPWTPTENEDAKIIYEDWKKTVNELRSDGIREKENMNSNNEKDNEIRELKLKINTLNNELSECHNRIKKTKGINSGVPAKTIVTEPDTGFLSYLNPLSYIPGTKGGSNRLSERLRNQNLKKTREKNRIDLYQI